MELAGDEKRIRALFSELSLEDAQTAPRFEKLWREASGTQHLPRLSKSLLVVATTLIVAVAVLFVAWSRDKWSRDKSPIQQNAQNMSPQRIPSSPAPQASNPDNKVAQRRRPSYSSYRRTLTRRHRSERALQQQAALLANWKSPTANFMTSPTRSGFSSLPQLNEAEKDFESFLGKKESNQ